LFGTFAIIVDGVCLPPPGSQPSIVSLQAVFAEFSPAFHTKARSAKIRRSVFQLAIECALHVLSVVRVVRLDVGFSTAPLDLIQFHSKRYYYANGKQ
jgi:hypothetical protein